MSAVPIFAEPQSAKNARVSTKTFEDAVERIGQDLKLADQPRAIVFHEKNGRRHAHCVWSRIDGQQLKAINLPYYKSKLTELSRELFLENGWDIPAGLIDRERRNPLNFTLEQWQQARRLNDDPRRIKATLRECWAISESKKAFETALKHKGYYLARGDRRGYVAMDWRGEVYSLSRWMNTKTRELKARLGPAQDLPSVDETQANINQKLVKRFASLTYEINAKHNRRMQGLDILRRKMTEKHRAERRKLKDRQDARRLQAVQQAQARFRTGVLGWWDRVAGQHAKIKDQNQKLAWQAARRDQKERDDLIHTQGQARSELQIKIDSAERRRLIKLDQLNEIAVKQSVDPLERQNAQVHEHGHRNERALRL